MWKVTSNPQEGEKDMPEVDREAPAAERNMLVPSTCARCGAHIMAGDADNSDLDVCDSCELRIEAEIRFPETEWTRPAVTAAFREAFVAGADWVRSSRSAAVAAGRQRVQALRRTADIHEFENNICGPLPPTPIVLELRAAADDLQALVDLATAAVRHS
ncbi:hypothetical protein MXD81_49750 [Microbacteriaceae bacterium K1510]|nr:hypothetical protein [Microbacteriaceae bacterium K1510]